MNKEIVLDHMIDIGGLQQALQYKWIMLAYEFENQDSDTCFMEMLKCQKLQEVIK